MPFTSYPVALMAVFSFASSTGPSEMITVSPLLWEEVTLSTWKAFLTASFTWDSHIPHIMPSTFTVVLIMLLSSIFYITNQKELTELIAYDFFSYNNFMPMPGQVLSELLQGFPLKNKWHRLQHQFRLLTDFP